MAGLLPAAAPGVDFSAEVEAAEEFVLIGSFGLEESAVGLTADVVAAEPNGGFESVVGLTADVAAVELDGVVSGNFAAGVDGMVAAAGVLLGDLLVVSGFFRWLVL